MYFFPGYITYEKQDSAYYLSSKLYNNQIRISDPALIKELEILLRNGGCESISSQLEIFLNEQSLLVSKSEIDTEVIRIKKMLSDNLLITIMPTESCNFRCPYCYENHSPTTMSSETLNSIISYIKNNVSKYKKVHLGWFGGEPTLSKNAVIESTKIIKGCVDNEKCTFQSSITSNGYLLNAETFKEFYNAGITSFQVTIDGWDHDKTRFLVTGDGTKDTIIKNLLDISKLSQQDYSFKITLRHNILADDLEYSWYDYLYRLFGQDDRFCVFVHPVGDWGGHSVKTLKLIGEKNEYTLLQKHINYLNKLGMQCENNRDGILSKVCPSSFPNSLVFRASGKIEKCTVALDNPLNCLGSIKPDSSINISEDINQLWCRSNLKENCYTCVDLLSCLNLHCRKKAVINKSENDCIYKPVLVQQE